jgi:hypothetical protein
MVSRAGLQSGVAGHAEFSRSFATPCCVARLPEPYDVRPLRGARHRMVLSEGRLHVHRMLSDPSAAKHPRVCLTLASVLPQELTNSVDPATPA